MAVCRLKHMKCEKGGDPGRQFFWGEKKQKKNFFPNLAITFPIATEFPPPPPAKNRYRELLKHLYRHGRWPFRGWGGKRTSV